MLKKKITIYFFFLFTFYYLINYEFYNNLFATDYYNRYKPNGLSIITNLINLDFTNINYFKPFFISELITGLLLKITKNQQIFSIFSNFFNILLLFFSFSFFFKCLDQKKNLTILFFFILFFSYRGNWIYCFYKLPEVFFLFIFSLIFYFTYNGVKKKNKYYLLISFFFCLLSLFIRPQGFLNVAFIIIIFFTYIKKKVNPFKLIIILFFIYLLSFPLLILILKNFNNPFIIHKIIENYVSGNIYFQEAYGFSGTFKYVNFLERYSLDENQFTELLYYYQLFLRKIIYQLTFLRETYSFKHNFFLFFYCLIIYFFLIINFNYLFKKNKLFILLVFIISTLSLLFHSSLATAAEPNRYQLFHLVPLYILVSISFAKSFQYFKNIFYEQKI
jgi:hypothetical protein